MFRYEEEPVAVDELPEHLDLVSSRQSEKDPRASRIRARHAEQDFRRGRRNHFRSEGEHCRTAALRQSEQT